MEVKNCPCCGTEAIVGVYPARKGWEATVQCNGCLLTMHTITYETKEEAEETVLRDWNKRVPL